MSQIPHQQDFIKLPETITRELQKLVDSGEYCSLEDAVVFTLFLILKGIPQNSPEKIQDPPYTPPFVLEELSDLFFKVD